MVGALGETTGGLPQHTLRVRGIGTGREHVEDATHHMGVECLPLNVHPPACRPASTVPGGREHLRAVSGALGRSVRTATVTALPSIWRTSVRATLTRPYGGAPPPTLRTPWLRSAALSGKNTPSVHEGTLSTRRVPGHPDGAVVAQEHAAALHRSGLGSLVLGLRAGLGFVRLELRLPGIPCCHAAFPRRSPSSLVMAGTYYLKSMKAPFSGIVHPAGLGPALGDGQVFRRTFRRAAVGEVTVTMIGLRGGGRAP